MELPAKVLKDTAALLKVDEVRVARDGDTGPFFLLRTRFLDDGYAYTAISTNPTADYVITYETLEAIRQDIKKLASKTNHYAYKEIRKPEYTVIIVNKGGKGVK